MKNIPDIKIGLVVGSTDWLPSEIAEQKRKELFDCYSTQYGSENIYECPICITDNEISVKRVSKDINKAECDAICLYWANYGPESAGTLFAKEFDGPVMMLAAAEEGQGPYIKNRLDAMSGFVNACYALGLREADVYIPSKPVGTISECAKMINDFKSIARTLIAVKNLKIISFGPRPSSYLASMVPESPLYNLGVELSSYSELELFDSYNKHAGDQRIDSVVESMKDETVNSNIFDNMLSKYAQYEITIKDWIRNYKGNRKYIALTSTCWPAFPVNFGFVPCYVNSRLALEGVPVACEVDVYGALTEYIGQCISNDTVAILNINNNIPIEVYDKDIKDRMFNEKKYSLEDLFLGYHCGVTSSNKIDNAKLDYHFVNKQLIGESQSSCTIQGDIKAGDITIFRIQGGVDGKLSAYVAQGQILPVSMNTYGGRGIIAIPEFGRFFRNVVLEKHFPNHTTVVFGHYGESIIGVLKQLGIEKIYFNQPDNMPYENENIFSTLNNWY